MSRLVTFRVGESHYAVLAELVNEVVETGPILHRLPSREQDGPSLAWIRGRWIPVVELASVLPEAERLDPDADASLLLVVGVGREQLGVRVAELGAVAEIAGDKRTGDDHRDDLVEVDGKLVRRVDAALLLLSDAVSVDKQGGAMPEGREPAEPLQVVTFRVGGEEFGVDVMRVSAVRKVPEVRAVPRAPDFVEGMVAVGGSVFPVIDMRKRFSVAASTARGAGQLLVVAAAESRIGLVVDEVPGVTRLAPESVSAAPGFFRGLAGRYLEGIANDGERLIILLDVDELLNSKERIAVGKMMEAAQPEADQSARAKTSAAAKRKRARRPSKKGSKKS